ncbi:hypothetical protein U729_3158 (plasmid) [Clostridium baratii str. Sullivan]|uniref:Uncharacterized protein n=1 Tax=Clostridium baratii str. Sullivan TaxID=1415775 RepID=A0A0A7G2B9_9CLOT|nr:hypothetical protein [Clostridium baratii]AIY85200.1 hypothetical protein U729_3158 [Clostridium baratii str. Sullivan]
MSNIEMQKIGDLKEIHEKPLFSSYEKRRITEDMLLDKSVGRTNLDIFSEEEKFYTCLQYDPCPICRKCLNKASNLYVRCQNCAIPICAHSHDVKEKMIKRKNFEIKLPDRDLENIEKFIEGSKIKNGLL